MTSTGQITRVALIQLCATSDVEENLSTAERLVRAAAADGARLTLLPEAFAFIGPDRLKREIVEPVEFSSDTPILNRCRELAKETGSELILGGHHEQTEDPARSYNTCIHLDSKGSIVSSYRKIHLFDVQLSDGTQLRESARTLPGTETVVTETPFGTLGLSICYDVRFPYLYQRLVDLGAIAISVPSAFTATTGAAHWHALLKARAIETQSYILAPAQYGQHNERRASYGHSLIIDPWGETLAELEDGDGFIAADIDPARVREVRQQLPSLQHRTRLKP
jgi:predicted amidohydrolase